MGNFGVRVGDGRHHHIIGFSKNGSKFNNIHGISVRTFLLLTYFFSSSQLSRLVSKMCKCSVTPGSRGLAVNSRASAAPVLRMSDVADAAVTAAEPEVMRPPINMPWESISDQVRRR